MYWLGGLLGVCFLFQGCVRTGVIARCFVVFFVYGCLRLCVIAGRFAKRFVMLSRSWNPVLAQPKTKVKCRSMLANSCARKSELEVEGMS